MRLLRRRVRVKIENNVWYVRLPKIFRDLKLIPEILNWEVTVKPHPSGDPLLAELVLRPAVKNRALLEKAAHEPVEDRGDAEHEQHLSLIHI